MSEKDNFAVWFEANSFGGDMWQDFRECHKQIEKLQAQLVEANEVINEARLSIEAVGGDILMCSNKNEFLDRIKEYLQPIKQYQRKYKG